MIALTLAALLTLIVYVLMQAFPSTEAVRLRNSLLITAADPRAGDWRPENTPRGFLTETLPIPASIASVARKATLNAAASDLDKARLLAGHLLRHIRDGGQIRSLDIEATYRAIIEDGRGYCADIIDAYVALALAAGIAVRHWGFSFDGFGGHGHTVAEIFDRNLRRWVMLDVYNNVMPLSASGEPLSVREFVPLFKSREAEVTFVAIAPGRRVYSVEEKLRAYYRDGLDQWYLWNGNNIVSRGRSNTVVWSLGAIFEPLGELAAISAGLFPQIVPLASPTNAVYVERMFALRAQLLSIVAVCAVLTLLLIGQLVSLRRRTRHRTTSVTAGAANQT